MRIPENNTITSKKEIYKTNTNGTPQKKNKKIKQMSDQTKKEKSECQTRKDKNTHAITGREKIEVNVSPEKEEKYPNDRPEKGKIIRIPDQI